MLRTRIPWLNALALLLLTGLATAEPPRDQQIAELEKQIQELTKKLADLKATPATPKPSGPLGLPDEWVKALKWRGIGPAAMGGRIVAFAVFEADPTTYWVATASGGLLKTTNNGTTFEHQFDRETTVSVGDVAVAPSNKDVVWVGTGENNPRNSVSYGDGVYKSTDGGKTWKNVGLKDSYQVGKIVIHPTNPDVVYVGALGRLYGPHPERGLFKTTDGGKTWAKVLFVDDKTGVIDVRMDPSQPETLLVATWERQRDGFDSHPGNDVPVAEGYDRYDPTKKWGQGGGIYKTTDGGKTFKKLTQGLPTCPTGRIGLDWYKKDPKVVFAIIDTAKIGMGTPPLNIYMGVQGGDAEGGGAKLTGTSENSPAAKAGLKAGDLIKAIDGKDLKNYEAITDFIKGKKAGDVLELTVQRDKETLKIKVTLAERQNQETEQQRTARLANLLGAFARDTDQGPRVLRITDEGGAARAGLEENDVIKQADKKPVKTFAEVLELLKDRKPGDKIVLTVEREKAVKEVNVVLAEPTQGFGPGGGSRTRPYAYMYGGQRENVQDQQGEGGQDFGGVYKSTDAGETWTRINSVNPRPMYFSQIRVDPSDDKILWVLGVSLYVSRDGGKTFKTDGNNGVHPDQHALWIDPRDGRHMVIGCDGGFYVTYDRAAHWDHLNQAAIGQFYHCAIDGRRPWRVYGGLQDNGSWGGPGQTFDGSGPINEDWIMVAGGDGFVCRVDLTDPDLVYYESQDGNIGRRNLRTGERGVVRPRPARGQGEYRFNWNTPFILSAHNPGIVYSAGNYVFRSVNKGADLRVISPEITRTKRGSGTAVAESPRNADVLWAGTDDGFLWVTRDGGKTWTNVTEKVGLAGPRWVASIEPSRAVEGRCYVAFDGHRSDDDNPLIYVTEDFGQTWKSLAANLPRGSTRVLREDLKNADLLYLGTEFAAYASVNRGASWTKINNNLPTVAVHEFAQHPLTGEMVAATHGRSLWVLDVTPLRQVTEAVLKAKANLFTPAVVVKWRSEPQRGSMYGNGSRRYAGENPAAGGQIFYSLTAKAEKVSLKILDIQGKTVRDLSVRTEAGLHLVTWDLRRGAEPAPTTGGPGGGGQGGGQGGGGRRPGGFGQGGAVPPGAYRVVLTVDGQEFAQSIQVEADPNQPANLIAGQDAEEDEDADREEREERGERDREDKGKIDY